MKKFSITQKFHRIGMTVVLGALTLNLVGCANTPNEFIEQRSKYADDYALDAEDYSEPTRFLYPIHGFEPMRNYNNLDNFYDDIDVAKAQVNGSNAVANSASAATIVMAGIGKISSFQAAMGLLAQQGTNTGYHTELGEQFLYTVIKVDESKDLDTQGVVATKIAINTVKEAMGDNAEEQYFSLNGFYTEELTKVIGSDDETCNQVYGSCYSHTYRLARLIRENDGYIPLAPQNSSYMVARTWLPIGFPIEKLKFANIEGVEQYLYVPAIKLNRSSKVWTESNLPVLTDWYNKERISVNPYLKRLSDSYVMYFNSTLQTKQNDPQSLYRVFGSNVSVD